jgi:hypothetical protein
MRDGRQGSSWADDSVEVHLDPVVSELFGNYL